MISFIADSKSLSSELLEKIDSLGISLSESPRGNEDFLIYCDQEENLSIVFKDQKTKLFFKNYFQDELLKHKQNLKHKSLLRKALGKKKLPVYDLTGGFLKDSLQMLCMDYPVSALENSKIPYFLLSWSFQKEKETVLSYIEEKQFHFINDDSINFLKKNDWEKDSILYLDPFFPDLKKNRLKRKEMIFLKSLAEEKFDELSFIDYCVDSDAKRVVVKRQLKSPLLGRRKPSYSLKGTTVRYDIYI